MSSVKPFPRRTVLKGALVTAAGASLPVAGVAAAAEPAEPSGPPVQLVRNTWPQVESYLKQSDGIIIPIGSTEQHGPNGPIGTDAACAEIVALEVGRRTGALVAPTLTIGMAQHHLAFPGTIALQPTTLIAVICDVVRSLAVQGFRHVYFLNGHGGNVAIIESAFQELRSESSLRGTGGYDGLLLLSENWYMGKRTLALSTELFGERDGSHAKPSEISLAWYVWPETAQPPMRFSPEIAARKMAPFGDGREFRARFPDGRVASDPSGASVEAGARLFAACVEDTVENFRAFMAMR